MYERKFFQLKKYFGWNEGDKPLVQHFIKGLNPRISEEVRTFKPKVVKEAIDQAKLTEMKFGFSTKSTIDPPISSSSKSQKPFRDDSKVAPSGFVSKSQKRKFNKFPMQTRALRFLNYLNPLSLLKV